MNKFATSSLQTKLLLAALIIIGAAGLLAIYGLSLQSVLLSLVTACLVIASAFDIQSRIIPVWIPISIAGLWALSLIALLIFGNSLGLTLPCASAHYFPQLNLILQSILESLIASVVITLFLLVLNGLTKLVFKTSQGIGGGDIKLFSALSLILGMQFSWINLLASCILGLIINFCSKALKGKNQESIPGFAFGPAITVSTYLCFILLGSM